VHPVKHIWCAFLLLLFPLSIYSQTISPAILNNSSDTEVLLRNWLYREGDDPRWASAQIDDSGWRPFEKTWALPDDWKGTGWFRIHLQMDPMLQNRPLAFTYLSGGKFDLYLDGQPLVHSDQGMFQLNPSYIQIPRPDAVLAVRYTNPDPHRFIQKQMNPGFSVVIQGPEVYSSSRITFLQYVFLGGITLAIAALHLVLYFFYRNSKINLIFSLLAISVCLLMFTELQDYVTARSAIVWLKRLWEIGMVLLAVLVLRFLDEQAGYVRKHYPAILFAGFVLILWGWNRIQGGWYGPAGVNNYISLFTVIVLVEALRVLIFGAMRNRAQGMKMLAMGGLPVLITGVYQTLSNFGVVPEPKITGDVPLPYYSFQILIVSMSVYLSRTLAQTSAENLRKTEELDEARKLQLSMLPKTVPDLPGMEIAIHMTTATEVGGDYYDFYRDGDSLTIAVGDATGHGAKAGVMVTAAKSLFQTLALEPEIPKIFSAMTRSLKRMNFGNTYMAMTIARLNKGNLKIACAGMPPALIYRSATRKVETVALKGIWLGGVSFPHQQADLILETGDSVLLMSDGFPERFNPAGQILGYDRAKELFLECASFPPAETLSLLVKESEQWAQGRPPDDDITFVLLKILEFRF
jgi:serine phosphatase RsbU (regulator of sigma subunit)